MSSELRGKIEVLSPAKINLNLFITGKREDGYHMLETVMVPVSIYDRIWIEVNFDGLGTIMFGDRTSNNIPKNSSNIAYRAIELFFKETGKVADVLLDIEKNIPVEAGLGGGSSNGASVLKALNELFLFPLSNDRLEKISSALGADVPFFIKSVPALCTGIGDEIQPLGFFEKKYILLVYPGKGLSTAKVYKKLNWGLTNKIKKNKRLVSEYGCFESLAKGNDLQGPAEEIMPELIEIKKLFFGFDGCNSVMSGSGPSMVGLFASEYYRNQAFKMIVKETKPLWKIYKAEFC